MIIPKMLINAVATSLTKHFKLDKILKYVEEPNEVYNIVSDHEKRIKKLDPYYCKNFLQIFLGKYIKLLSLRMNRFYF